MNILIVSQYFWPESFLVNGLVSELQSKGHQVTVLTGLPNYPKGKFNKGYGFFSGPWSEDYNQAKVIRVPLIARGQNKISLVLNYLSFVVFGTLFSIFRVSKKTDVIFCVALSPITSAIPAIFLRWYLKKPVVLWVQDLWPESLSAVGVVQSNKILNTVGLLVRFIYRRCDLLLGQSEAFKTSLLRWGADDSKIGYLPNWAEPFANQQGQVPDWVQALPKGFKIGFAGNVGKAQNMRTLVEAADKLRNESDIKWIVVGDGSDKKWLQDEIVKRSLQNSIFTIGQKPYSDMQSFFASCDLLLVSLTDTHIFSLTIPSKIQAYMSAGKPILCSVPGEGARVVQQASAGISVSPERPDLLAEAIINFRKLDTSEINKMGENGKQYFKVNFEKNSVLLKLESFLNQILKNNKNGA